MPFYNFDRSKPFYPLIMTFLGSLHGTILLCAAGVPGLRQEWRLDAVGTEEEREVVAGQVRQLLAPLSLAVTGDNDRIPAPLDFVARELLVEHAYLLEFQMRAALTMLVMAHEVTRDRPYRTNDPMWEFLRHCRNAAAHNGRWAFNANEPRRPASWRGINLDQGMAGGHLMHRQDRPGTLQLGDPIALLWDIEQAYPEITL